jgi:DNA polymerase-3 subunit alpha|tara:strand:- start:52 stop:1605 length:1554 start_codon:yes stop_codon:yes gene_type:complete
MFDINNFEDEAVWDLICDGRTKGVFQLESSLGRHWSKQVRPRSIKELAALISLIRPGCLKAKDANGKSMTQVYVDRKSNKEPVTYPDEALKESLSETYGVLVYQEQSMKIAQRLAGFDLKEADALRKAIGKKKAGLMEEVKKNFLEGTRERGIVSDEVAEEIFSWIEKSNRYAFNKSHAVSYAINAYWSAYCKLYRPISFYVSYLNHSERKPDSQRELKELIVDAKFSDIEVYPPRLNHLHTSFISKENCIYFGLNHIKHVGRNECKKIEEICDKNDISGYSWMDVLTKVIHRGRLNKRSVTALISVGAFNGENNKRDRQKMLYEYDSWRDLTSREQQGIVDLSDSFDKGQTLSESISQMINTTKINSRRITTVLDIKKILDNPPHDLKDNIPFLAQSETEYLSFSLSCSKTDAFNINFASSLCREIAKGAITGKTRLAAQISTIRLYKTKKGKNPGQLMAFVTAEDGSGELDSITVFPECYSKHKDVLVEGNTVLMTGEISKRENTSLIVDKVSQL